MTLANKTFARHSWMIAGAAAIAIFAGSAQAGTDAPQVTVRYAKLTDASHLYSRLQTASESVCRQHEGKELRHAAAMRACYNDALNKAVAKVGDSSLSTLHRSNDHMRLAESNSVTQRS